MTDRRTTPLARLAHLLVNYCTAVRPGDWVLVTGHVLALPLVEEVVREVTRAGGHATVHLGSETLDEAFLGAANEAQLAWLSPAEELMAERLDVHIGISASGNTRSLSNLPPERQAAQARARRPVSRRYMQRAATGEHRWVTTNYPCAAFAQEADMSLREYEEFVYAATYADQDDPMACWRAVHDRQQRLVEWLRGKSDVTVRGPHADLRLSIAGRTFINSDGRRNMPSGEIFTGPVEESANGWIRFGYPAIRQGRSVEGVELEFRDGKVLAARAEKNEEYLLAQLETDPGARLLGEFAVGTNERIQRFTKNILYDEKIGGTMHVALGAGYPETGSKNESAIHWDFICDMRTDSEIRVDGELFYRDGQFQVE